MNSLAEPFVQQMLLSEAIEQGPALVFVADDHMKYVAVNLSACTVLGYTRAELVGMHVTDVAVAPEAPELYGEMRRERGQRGVTPIKAKDGRVLQFTYSASEATVSGLPYYVSIGFVD